MVEPRAAEKVPRRCWRVPVAVLLCCAALAAALVPYLESGFYSDDIANSTAVGARAINGTSLWSGIAETHQAWKSWSGRYFPVGVAAGSVVWHFASERLANRLVQIAFVISNVVVCALLLRRLTSSTAVPIVFVGILPAFFQVRAYHDPMTSFSPLLQLTLLLALLTAHLFARFLETSKPVAYFSSVALHAAALCTYEPALVTMPILVALALIGVGQRGSKRWAALGGHALLTAAFVGWSLYLRAHAAGGYPGTEAQFGARTLATFLLQLDAAVPLNYLRADPQKLFQGFPTATAHEWTLVAVLFGATVGGVYAALQRNGAHQLRSAPALLVGTSLAIVPAALIAVSAKYQHELVRGWGYLPVYLQFFGVAIICATLMCVAHAAVARRGSSVVGRVFGATISVAAGATAATAFLANTIVVEHQNAELRYPRELMVRAAERRLFHGVKDDSILLRDNLAPWDTPGFYFQHTGRRFRIMTPQQWLSAEPDSFFGSRRGDGDVYELNHTSDRTRRGDGCALLARVEQMEYRKRGADVTVLGRVVSNPRYYLQQRTVGRPVGGSPYALAGWFSQDAITSWVHVNAADPAPRRQSAHWRFVRLRPGRYRNLALMTAQAAGQGPPAAATPVDVAIVPRPGSPRNGADERTRAVGFGCGYFADRVVFPGIPHSRVELDAAGLANGLAVAFYVKPARQHVQYATLLSNRGQHFRGFTFEQNGSGDPAKYAFAIGAGAESVRLGEFTLPPQEWSVVVVSLASGEAKVRVVARDRDEERSVQIPAGGAVAADIVRVGNWAAGDRPFTGEIKQLMQGSAALDGAGIAAIVDEFRPWAADQPRE